MGHAALQIIDMKLQGPLLAYLDINYLDRFAIKLRIAKFIMSMVRVNNVQRDFGWQETAHALNAMQIIPVIQNQIFAKHATGIIHALNVLMGIICHNMKENKPLTLMKWNTQVIVVYVRMLLVQILQIAFAAPRIKCVINVLQQPIIT